MPDFYSDLSFFFFFLQSTDLTLEGPLFTETTKLVDQASDASGNAYTLAQRVPPFMFTFLNVT